MESVRNLPCRAYDKSAPLPPRSCIEVNKGYNPRDLTAVYNAQLRAHRENSRVEPTPTTMPSTAGLPSIDSTGRGEIISG